MTKIYRMETWMPKEQAWKIEGYCSEVEDAAVMGLAFTLKGNKFGLTVIDLDDIQERDAICAYLTEYMRERIERERNQVKTPEVSDTDAQAEQGTADWENEGGSFGESNQRLIDDGIVEF